MKSLRMRRHSLKDGPDNTIGPKGAALAVREGNNEYYECFQLPEWVFVGPLVRTRQTANLFFFLFEDEQLSPDRIIVIPEFGDDALFKAMATPEFREQTKAGFSNYDALLKVHSPELVSAWRKLAFAGITSALSKISDGKTGDGFGHSPMIELAISQLFSPEYANAGPETFEIFDIRDLEGAIFEQDDEGIISVSERIDVDPYEFGF